MSKARIFNPPKSATQSGQSRSDGWVLEHAPKVPKRIDPLTGWWGSTDMSREVSLHFETLEAAVAYAKAEGLDYEVEARPQVPAIQPKSYADNFRTDRRQNWTH
ncbi:ETC complex I subunit [Roseomonas elaeocarpi]|uniref:ETC complex I subunit n=1 Tax=Roseomonas elaeocarpi TaxID=907779 RepID=A0ABV6JXV6_9PROT